MSQLDTTRSLPTISFTVPTYWTAEQALAVLELLEDLRRAIWDFYGLQVIDLTQGQNMPLPDQSVDQPNPPDNQAF